MATNLQLALKVAKQAQLKSIVLRSAHIESLLGVNEVPESVAVGSEHRCTLEVAQTDEASELHVMAEFRLNACKGSDEGEAAVRLECSFALVYEVPDSAVFEDLELQHFAEVNGAYNAWPYWRELVQTATGRVGLTGIVVPLYRPISVQIPDVDKPGADA